MENFYAQIIDKLSFFHLNMLLLLGLALFGGTMGARLFQSLRIPQVVGYIAIGIIIGRSGLRIIGLDTLEALKPFNYFALGLIGFTIGGELKRTVFAKYGKQFMSILLWEGITPFIVVTLLVGTVGSLFFESKIFIWPLAFLLGAIASATDPATTITVLKEYKTKGPVTTNILGIVALDDALALILFAIASLIAELLMSHGESTHIVKTILHAFYEIGGAVLLGALSGIALSKLLRAYIEREKMLAFSIGAILFVTGLSLVADVSLLLAVMTLGVVVVNYCPRKSKEIFSAVDEFTSPVYVLFFVLIGAQLKFSYLTFPLLILILIYIVFGISGKMIGANIGARLSGSPSTVRKYLPFALFSQAGVAIGLSLLAVQRFPGDVSNALLLIITSTTFITQIIGPPFIKFAVTKSGEVGLNITEEDIIQKSKAEDIMNKNPALIKIDMSLQDILTTFSENDSLYYPVVNKNKELSGIITVDGIKQIFLETVMEGIIIAHDLMEPVAAKTFVNTPMIEVNEIMNNNGFEYLPVVDEKDILKGFIERRNLDKYVSTKMIELQKHTDSLDDS